MLTAIELERALDEGRLVAVYQPCFDLRTGQLVAVEALARLRDPLTADLLPPSLFIPTAEVSGLVTRLDLMMVEQAFRQVARWRSTDAGRDLCVAINLSAPDLDDPAIAERIRRLAEDARLPIGAVIVELTETVLAQRSRGHDAAMAALSELGCNVTLDDFGTGNASFAYLERFDVQGIKIDRSFTRMLGDGGARQRMAESLIRFCLSLDLHVVAEGIEEPSQLAALRSIGAHFGQGFLLARPMSAEQLDAEVLTRRIDLPGRHGTPVTAEPSPREVIGRLPRSRTPLLAALVVLMTLCLAVLTVVGQRHASDSLRHAALDRLVTVDSLAAGDISKSVGDIVTTVVDSVRSAEVRRALRHRSGEGMEDELASILSDPSAIYSASLYDARGTLLALAPIPATPGLIGRNFSFRDWYRGARSHSRPYVSVAFQLATPRHPWAIAVSAAVRDGRGRPVGYLVATYVLSGMQAELSVALARQGVAATLVDAHGAVLATPHGDGLGLATRDARLLAGARASGQDSVHDVQWAVQPVPALGGWLLAEQGRPDVVGAYPTADRQLIGIVGVLALGAIVLVLLWARSDRRRRRLQAGLNAAHGWLASVLASTPSALVVCDADGRVQSCNDAMVALLGTTPEELRGTEFGTWVPMEDRPREEGVLTTGIVTAAGARRAVEVRTELLDDPQGRPMQLHSIVDVTPHREEHERLRVQGRTDPLTGVGNRRALRERLLEASVDLGSSYAVVMMDLDGFKAVNDAYGHSVGDELLCAVAATLDDSVGPDGHVARLGGDEFVSVVPMAEQSQRDEVADRLHLRVMSLLESLPAARDVGVAVSTGAAVVGGDGLSVDDLILVADQRMYAAKRSGHASRGI